MLKNILFDLGGVLLNLDMSKTRKAFADLGWAEENWKGITQSGYLIFENLETGVDTKEQFRERMRQVLPGNPSDEKIDFAWNAMLLDFPVENVDYLKELGKKYKLFVLSNTNELHVKRFREIFMGSHGFPIDELVEKCYYSHEIGFRKPDSGAFYAVLQDARIDPTETLFIDDLQINTDEEEKLGMMVLHIAAGTLIQSLPGYLEKNGF